MAVSDAHTGRITIIDDAGRSSASCGVNGPQVAGHDLNAPERVRFCSELLFGDQESVDALDLLARVFDRDDDRFFLDSYRFAGSEDDQRRLIQDYLANLERRPTMPLIQFCVARMLAYSIDGG